MAANIYNNLSAAQNNSPSCCPPDPPDDISLFLQQIIFRSSPPPSSSSSSITARHQPFAALSNLGHGVFSTPGQISAPEPPPALMNSSSGFGPPAATANVSSSSAGRLDSEADEYDYDSEDVVEAVVEEAAARPTPRRSSSKRSRAAEVHNQSEKRRRRKINEKMKALQNLIPNSNKTDKASMLDEAIEYLKQLQLQVQTLTMRNGLSLYPNCAPGIQHMYQMKMDPDFDFETAHANPTGSVPMDHQNIADHLIRLEDKCDNNKQAPVMDFSCTIASKPSFKVESKSSTMLDHFGTYHRTRSSKKPANEVFPRTSSTGTSATSSILCGTNMSDLKESTIETCLVGGDHLLQNFVNHPIFSSHLNM